MLHDRVKRATYTAVTEKMRKDLEGWKVEKLSFAGGAILTQSVLLSLPYYTMQTTKLPESICDEIEKVSRQFLWGSSESRPRMHMVKWQKLTLPREWGGLNIREAKKRF